MMRSNLKRAGAIVAICAIATTLSLTGCTDQGTSTPTGGSDKPGQTGGTEAVAEAELIEIESLPCGDYDLDGDGTADTVKIKTKKYVYDDGSKDEYAYTAMTLKVNDTSVKLLKDDYFFYPVVKYIKLSNGNAYLNVVAVSENDFPVLSCVYEYSNGEIKEVLNCNQEDISFTYDYAYRNQGEVRGVEQNTLTVSCSSMVHAAGMVSFSYDFELRDGEFVRTSYETSARAAFIKCSKDYSESKAVKWSPTLRDVKLYDDVSCETSVTLEKGTSAKVTGVYLKGKKKLMKIETKSGKSGYIKPTVSGEWDDENECMEGQIFKYALYAG